MLNGLFRAMTLTLVTPLTQRLWRSIILLSLMLMLLSLDSRSSMKNKKSSIVSHNQDILADRIILRLKFYGIGGIGLR